MVRPAEERFAMERMATRGFGTKRIAAALGAGGDNEVAAEAVDGDMASCNIGRPRGAEVGVCVLFLVLSVPHCSNCHVCLSFVGQWL